MVFHVAMQMDDKQIDEIRSLQDQIVSICDRLGYDNDMIVSSRINEPITIKDLRYYIYPQYKFQLEGILQILKGEKRQ